MAVTINASTSAGLVMTSDLSGVLTLQQNGVALPNGGVAPAFRAYATAGTTIGAGATTKITFDTKDYDTNTNYSTANSRFTPTVAGYYQISLGVRPTTSTSSETGVYLYKNGSNYETLYDATTVLYNISASALVYMNGSTDYLEVFMYAQTAGTTNFGNSSAWFSGCLVRGA
jgi:hypothetical protein